MGALSVLKGIFSRSISFEIAIVSVVATIIAVYAAPLYSDYVIRAKVLEALQLAEPIKRRVVEFNNIQGKMPTPADMDKSNIFISHPAKGVLSIGFFGQGKIAIITDDLGGDTEYGQQIVLVPDQAANTFSWRCLPADLQPAFPVKYLPRSCS